MCCSMDMMANTMLCVGASPAMAHSVDEVEAFQKVAAGLLVNVGTLSPEWVASMKLAARSANEAGHPWVLDPVGAGATRARIQVIEGLLQLKPTLVRGNASEIMAVAGVAGASSKGVDSTAQSEEALEAGKRLAKDVGCVVAISGATDLITDGSRVVQVQNGVADMTNITAAGCAVTAMATAFIVAAPDDAVMASACALAVFGLAAELASTEAKGPASLRVGMLDHLHSMTQEQLTAGLRLLDLTSPSRP